MLNLNINFNSWLFNIFVQTYFCNFLMTPYWPFLISARLFVANQWLSHLALPIKMDASMSPISEIDNFWNFKPLFLFCFLFVSLGIYHIFLLV